MKLKSLFLAVAIVIVVFVVAFSATNIIGSDKVQYSEQPLVNQASSTSDASQVGVQNVKLSYINYKYKMEPSVLKMGIPVEMEVDLNTVTGCMTSVTIPGFGVRKYVSPGDTIIKFTPDKAGTFQIACSMGMGRNTFEVIDDSGSTGSYTEPVQTSAPSCGASGGCGCGASRY